MFIYFSSLPLSLPSSSFPPYIHILHPLFSSLLSPILLCLTTSGDRPCAVLGGAAGHQGRGQAEEGGARQLENPVPGRAEASDASREEGGRLVFILNLADRSCLYNTLLLHLIHKYNKPIEIARCCSSAALHVLYMLWSLLIRQVTCTIIILLHQNMFYPYI